MEIPDLIRSARKKAGLTQEELAEKIGVKRGAIARWESGVRMPRFGYVMKIASATGNRIEILFQKKKLQKNP